MTLLGKVNVEVEVKASASELHNVFGARPHHISNICPDKVQACALHEGEWGKPGSIIFWNYVQDGKEKVAKEIIEAIDDEKNSTRFRVIEGDLLEEYKSFVITIQATQKGEGSVVHFTMEYEKLHEGVDHPEKFLELAANVAKDIDAHLVGS